MRRRSPLQKVPQLEWRWQSDRLGDSLLSPVVAETKGHEER
jgi:hypothetical protein